MLFVTGATGSVGKRIVTNLLGRNAEFKALTRSPEKWAGLAAGGMQIVEGDLEQPERWADQLRGMDTLFLILLNDAEEVLRAAAEHGVKRIVFLSSGSVNRDSQDRNRNAEKHFAVEQRIREYGFDYVFLRPEAFMHNAVYWKDLFRYNKGTLDWPALNATLASVHEQDIADVAALVLTDFDRFAGQILTLTGANVLTQRGMLEEIVRQSKRRIDLREQSVEEFAAYMRNFMAEEYIELRIDDWRYSLTHRIEVHSTVYELLGREPLTFREWVAEHLELFEPQ